MGFRELTLMVAAADVSMEAVGVRWGRAGEKIPAAAGSSFPDVLPPSFHRRCERDTPSTTLTASESRSITRTIVYWSPR